MPKWKLSFSALVSTEKEISNFLYVENYTCAGCFCQISWYCRSLRALIRLQKGFVPTYYKLPLVCCDGRVLFRPCDCYSLGAKYMGCACESRHTQIQYAIYRIVAQYGGHSAVKRFSPYRGFHRIVAIGWVYIGRCERIKLFILNFPFHCTVNPNLHCKCKYVGSYKR